MRPIDLEQEEYPINCLYDGNVHVCYKPVRFRNETHIEITSVDVKEKKGDGK